MLLEEGHPIKAVARRTGLSQHAIRMWEKRYGAITPSRTETNRRRYSDEDVQRLMLLCRAKRAGHSIGQIAKLPTEQLQALVQEDESAEVLASEQTQYSADSASTQAHSETSQTHLSACLEAVEQLNAEALESAFLRASIALGRVAVIDQVLVPLAHQVGERWRAGSLRIVHEHLASAATRFFLDGLRSTTTIPASAPRIVITTPAGQPHELGALAAAATAATEGWNVSYLGANLPAEEIVAAVDHSQAQALALSIVYPPDDPHLGQELRTIRRSLPEDVAILIGGRAAVHYQQEISEIGATRLGDLPSFRHTLEEVRTPQ